MLRTALCNVLGIDVPIILALMRAAVAWIDEEIAKVPKAPRGAQPARLTAQGKFRNGGRHRSKLHARTAVIYSITSSARASDRAAPIALR
jgi:hypothetical protein